MQRREFLKHSAAISAAAGGRLSAAGAGFQAGFVERDITPDVPREKIHDPCKVRAAVFSDGRTRIALVGVDVIGVPRLLVEEARQSISGQCGIPPMCVLVGASHSHSGGPIGRTDPAILNHEDPVVRNVAASRGEGAAYTKRVQDQIVAAVVEADKRRAGALAGVGSGMEGSAVFNRRVRMKNGLTYTHPGTGNPDSIKFAGPIDPEVGVIGVWDTNGRMTGCIVNYACHATTSPPGISANWIYYMEKVVRQVMGPAVVVVFLQGCCGDVTHVDNFSRYRMPTGDEYARLIGGRVGAEVIKVLFGMTPGELAPLDARQKILSLQFRMPRPDRVERCRQVVQLDPKQADPTELFFARIVVLHAARAARQSQEEAEVQAIQVGPAVFLTNPSELFCQYGLDIKAKSPFPKTFPVELANGSVGYVPTEDAFGPNGGGYETRIGTSRLEITAGRKMVEAALELAAQLKPGKLPSPEPAPPFNPKPGNIGPHPWSYGNVPPQLT